MKWKRSVKLRSCELQFHSLYAQIEGNSDSISTIEIPRRIPILSSAHKSTAHKPGLHRDRRFNTNIPQHNVTVPKTNRTGVRSTLVLAEAHLQKYTIHSTRKHNICRHRNLTEHETSRRDIFLTRERNFARIEIDTIPIASTHRDSWSGCTEKPVVPTDKRL